MADSPPFPGTPRWVKVSGLIALVLFLLFVLVHLSGHGLAHHTPSGGLGGEAPHQESHR